MINYIVEAELNNVHRTILTFKATAKTLGCLYRQFYSTWNDLIKNMYVISVDGNDCFIDIKY